MNKYVDKDGLQYFAEELTAKNKEIFAVKAEVGTPLVAATAAAMTDTSKIYVYTGSETGYTAGDWYYYDGSDWVSGGVYNSVAVQTDTTLSVAGMAADAEKVGEELEALDGRLDTIEDGYVTESEMTAAISENTDVTLWGNTIGVSQGYWAVASGAATNSSTWCKTEAFVDRNLKIHSTYKMFLLAFDKDTKAYVGTWNGSEFSTTYNQNAYLYDIDISVWLANYPGYIFKIDFYNGSTVLTPAMVKEGATISNALEDKVDGISSDYDDLYDELENNNIIHKIYSPVKTIENATINTSGYIVGTSGYNVYVYNISAGNKIKVTGGYIYGLYASEPVLTTSQAVDETSHQGTLNNTVITMPTGANYIAIRNTTVTTVISGYDLTNELVDGLVVDIADVQSVIGSALSFTESGFINADTGGFVSNTAYRSTDYVPITAKGTYLPLKYRVKGINTTGFAYYDGEKALIKAIPIGSTSSLEEKTGTLDYASGAVYVRLCTYVGTNESNAYTDYYAEYASMKNTVTGIIPYPTDYQGSEISVFNKILCIGDSLTSGTFNYREGSSASNYVEYAKYSYPTYLKKITGCDTTNMGNGGKTSLEWYELHENDDLSGYDCAIIQLGVNDVGRYSTWGQNSIDGFTGIITKLKNENKNIKIFVANIIPARSYHSDAYISMSDAISAFVEGLSDPQVMLLNMQQYGHTYDSAAYNCGHLSALGYQRLAQDYKSYISYYIFMNKTDFKEVQFIGTDYYYDPIS